MTVRDHLAALDCSTAVLRFCEFVFRDVPWGELPAFASIEFIRLPDLAPNCFAIDIRGGYEKGLLIKYSGTYVDDHFGRNVQGLNLEDVYRDPSRLDAVRDMYRRCVTERVVCYRRRPASLDYRVVGRIEGGQDLLLVPCTGKNGDRVEYVVGIGVFEEGKPRGRDADERLAFLGVGD